MKLCAVAQGNDHLEQLELNPWRVLVIAAHPGDIEAGASAAVAKWTQEGAEVSYLVATRGELSMPGIEPADAALIRSAEQSAAASVVGVQVVDFLDIDDGAVEASVPLRRAMVRDIRHARPDIVVVMNHREQEADGTLNDADHRATGTAALDAVRAAANQWAFRDVGAPHTVETVLVAGSPTPTHAIDVAGFETPAADAFAAHKEHLAAISGHPMADPAWVTTALQTQGERLPESTAAVTVEQINLRQGRPCHSFIVSEYSDPDGTFQTMKLSKKERQSKTPARARNAAPAKRKAKDQGPKPKVKQADPSVSVVPAMKLKVRLEKNGRSSGIEIPANVMERLGDEQRPSVVVEINDTSFESAIGTTNGKRFIAINAERRKAAAIDVDDEFFVALSKPGDAAAATPISAPEANAATESPKPKRNRRKRPPKD